MLLKLQDGRYVFECRFDERMAPKDAGFSWDGQAKCWATASHDIAARLLAHATPEARLAIGKAMAGLQAVRAMSTAAVPTEDIKVPAPEGCTYMPFQLAGIQFIAQRFGLLASSREGGATTAPSIAGVLLADEMGL